MRRSHEYGDHNKIVANSPHRYDDGGMVDKAIGAVKGWLGLDKKDTTGDTASPGGGETKRDRQIDDAVDEAVNGPKPKE